MTGEWCKGECEAVDAAEAIDRIDPPGRSQRVQWNLWLMACRAAFAVLKAERAKLTHEDLIKSADEFSQAVNAAWQKMKGVKP